MATRKHTSINPTEHNVPKMDRPSIAFAWFLDSMSIESNNESGGFAVEQLYLVCGLCAERICEIDDGDNLHVLLNTALAHDC